MTFELSDEQVQRFVIWRTKLETKHKRYGKYRFEFSSSGIGEVVKVKSDLTHKKLNLTDYDKW